MTAVPMRLPVRPSQHPALAGAAGPGLHRIEPPPGAPWRRPALARVPRALPSNQPVALAVVLHGSGGEPGQALDYLEPSAAAAPLVLVAPPSRDFTWDTVLGRPGPDIETVAHALRWAFDRFVVAPRRLAVAGFSDGASHALALAIANGDVFASLAALSPGFVPPGPATGRARMYVAHGTADTVLPIARCSRRIVPALERAGFEVRYDEFVGGHEIPPAIAERACQWILAS
ncbi:MAG TPA: phospholipase [Ramlibacter sp.]|jgi:predicted esterase|uniref:alpha/beta hydrolase n=1 Tax=Ramlibacter sp. TaxID=1917967 RepID=UPI002D39649A|nr:phospholipase [Ramlibacter sp.]HZY17326.1 phospholipase [Ramlibacter sp.]